MAEAATIERAELVPFRSSSSYKVSCTWGSTCLGTSNYHPYPAIDIALPDNTVVTAAGAGLVTFASTTTKHASYGFYVLVYHSGDNRTSLYAHLRQTPLVKTGQRVLAGQEIGRSGNTGSVSGSGGGYHLHYAEGSGKLASPMWKNVVDPGRMTGGSGRTRTYYPDAWGFTDWKRANNNRYSIARNRLVYAPGDWKGYIVQWDGDTKAQRTAWLVGSDYKRRWIETTSIYYCLKSKGVPGPQTLPSSALNDLGLSSTKATC